MQKLFWTFLLGIAITMPLHAELSYQGEFNPDMTMPEYFEAGCYYSFYFNDARLSEADALDFIKKNIETAYILNDTQMYDVFISKFKNELTNSDVVSELNSGN